MLRKLFYGFLVLAIVCVSLACLSEYFTRKELRKTLNEKFKEAERIKKDQAILDKFADDMRTICGE